MHDIPAAAEPTLIGETAASYHNLEAPVAYGQ